MNEEMWSICPDPQPIIEFLPGSSNRKLRLLAAACCRLWLCNSDRDDFVWSVLKVAEHYADGLASEEERQHYHAAAYEWYDQVRWDDDRERTAIAHAINWSVHQEAFEAARHCYAGWDGVGPEEARAARSTVITTARDIFNNPFRRISIYASWLSWHNGTIPRLAQAIYEDRELPSGHLDTKRMAVLADALEEAGCNDATILDHLRSSGPHVRGCFVIDALTGRS